MHLFFTKTSSKVRDSIPFQPVCHKNIGKKRKCHTTEIEKWFKYKEKCVKTELSWRTGRNRSRGKQEVRSPDRADWHEQQQMGRSRFAVCSVCYSRHLLPSVNADSLLVIVSVTFRPLQLLCQYLLYVWKICSHDQPATAAQHTLYSAHVVKPVHGLSWWEWCT